ncbi:hypothetical protein G6F50_016576 [Rhizopus delemar]|uniref:Uncharacterized protein n=1 Tax=Rhizopus delemar TaxID=936053 RepID=A0A9P6XSU0_9FUNG|nr:hypothetical protein G6F50_016576 [Rhizopus delemar]
MQHGLRHVLLDHAFGHAQGGADLVIAHAVDLRHQERLPWPLAQPIEHGVHRHQRFQRQGGFFGRRSELLGLRRHGLQPGLFDLLAPPVVKQQMAGDGGQVGARLADLIQVRGLAQDSHEHVVGQIRRLMHIVQHRAQPCPKPTVVAVGKWEPWNIKG